LPKDIQTMLTIDLTDRVAVVTGSSRGIGHATARLLLEAGASVVLNARAPGEEAESAFADLAIAHPGRTATVYGSVADPATSAAVGKLIMAQYKRLDVLVNNAGILRDRLIGMIPDAEIDEVLATNVGGVLRMSQIAARLMTRRRSGSIINLASIIGRRGNPGQFVYGAAKAAVIGATYSAAKELAPLGIRVNAVAPGLIDTAMIADLPEEKRNDLTARIGMGRPGTPEDIAGAVLFLASDLSTYVTGQVLGVDGALIV
jgi:3-oxoacyl-[acyl-carrier protein] reductase